MINAISWNCTGTRGSPTVGPGRQGWTLSPEARAPPPLAPAQAAALGDPEEEKHRLEQKITRKLINYSQIN